MAFVFLALQLSLDSFLAACALAPLGLTRRECIRLAAAFGFCDGLASLISAQLGSLGLPGAGQAGPAVMAVYGVCVLLLGRMAVWETRFLRALPLLLCLDNLSAPAAPALAPLLGVASAALAMAGFSVGALFSGLFERYPRAAGGVLIAGAWLLLG